MFTFFIIQFRYNRSGLLTQKPPRDAHGSTLAVPGVFGPQWISDETTYSFQHQRFFMMKERLNVFLPFDFCPCQIQINCMFHVPRLQTEVLFLLCFRCMVSTFFSDFISFSFIIHFFLMNLHQAQVFSRVCKDGNRYAGQQKVLLCLQAKEGSLSSATFVNHVKFCIYVLACHELI